MLPPIQQHRDQIAQLCQRFGVKTLELFGSVANGDFTPDKSALDFFVEFLDYKRRDIADNGFGLQESLEDLFNRKADLVSVRTAKNLTS